MVYKPPRRFSYSSHVPIELVVNSHQLVGGFTEIPAVSDDEVHERGLNVPPHGLYPPADKVIHRVPFLLVSFTKVLRCLWSFTPNETGSPHIKSSSSTITSFGGHPPPPPPQPPRHLMGLWTSLPGARTTLRSFTPNNPSYPYPYRPEVSTVRSTSTSRPRLTPVDRASHQSTSRLNLCRFQLSRFEGFCH